jgi:hypothetical protein
LVLFGLTLAYARLAIEVSVGGNAYGYGYEQDEAMGYLFEDETLELEISSNDLPISWSNVVIEPLVRLGSVKSAIQILLSDPSVDS